MSPAFDGFILKMHQYFWKEHFIGYSSLCSMVLFTRRSALTDTDNYSHLLETDSSNMSKNKLQPEVCTPDL